MPSNKLPALAAAKPARVRARDDQLDVQPYEGGLVDLARVHHPTVAWWHGYRRAEERFGSYCYIHEEFIVTWPRFEPIPMAAKERIDEHKRAHRAGK